MVASFLALPSPPPPPPPPPPAFFDSASDKKLGKAGDEARHSPLFILQAIKAGDKVERMDDGANVIQDIVKWRG